MADAQTPTPAVLAQRMRDACASVRAKSYPLADLIPLMQQAADALAAQAPAQQVEAVAWAATSVDGEVEALGMNQSRRFDTPLYFHPAPSHRAVMQQALDAIDAEFSDEWECNSYHPKLHVARAALYAALSATMEKP